MADVSVTSEADELAVALVQALAAHNTSIKDLTLRVIGNGHATRPHASRLTSIHANMT